MNRLTIFITLNVLISCTERKPVFLDAPELHYNFERIGPGGGGSTFIPTFSFHDPKTFLLRCDMTGAYITCDGGESYVQINLPGGASAFAWDPKDSSVVWAGGLYLHRSLDGGRTWARIFPKDSLTQVYAGDHAEPIGASRDGMRFESRVGSILPEFGRDGGAVFTYGDRCMIVGTDGRLIHSYQLDGPGTIAMGWNGEVMVYTGKSEWRFDGELAKRSDLPQGMAPLGKVSVGSAGKERYIKYAVGGDGGSVWIARDGENWTRVPDLAFPASTERKFGSISCSDLNANIAYLVVDQLVESKGASQRAWSGVMKTEDGGQHWKWSLKQGGGRNEYAIQDGQPPANLTDAWAGEAFGREYVAFLDAGVDPHDGRHAVVTDWYRTLKTDDGGETWSAAYSSSKHDGTSVSGGLDVTTCYRVHFDPFDPKHIAVSYTDIGFQHSFDGGGSWVRSCTGVPREWNNTCYDVVFDPKVKGRMWSAWSGTHDIPRGKMTRNPKWKSTVKGGVCMSDDGGKTWKPVLTGMGDDNAVTSLLMDPNSSPGQRILYAAVYNKGVFRSDDDGRRWTLVNNGIGPNTAAFALAMDKKGRVFVTVCPTPDHRADGSTKGILPGAVYRTDDKGESWLLFSEHMGPVFPVGISVDPHDPDRLYLSCWGDISVDDQLGKAKSKELGLSGTLGFKGGVWTSSGDVERWSRISDSNWYAYDVTPDPKRPGRLYANTFNLGAWQSEDNGVHWAKIHGYDFAWGHRVIPDPYRDSVIYITTYGSGVWRGVSTK